MGECTIESVSNAANNLPVILTFSSCPRSISAWTAKHKTIFFNPQKIFLLLHIPPSPQKGAVVLTSKLNAGWQRDAGL